jgi:phosphatidylglycerol lysyltransferase
MLAFKEAGYERFSLGMAPLSGFQPTPLASSWHRLGALIWQHGNRLYNFQGLRLFKAKFNPVWESRYLAASGTIGPFVALADVASDGRGRREPRSFPA